MKTSTCLKIGLTGGIGAGKSTVAAMLASCGAVVLDADAISRASLMQDGACYADVIAAFGTGILLPTGGIDRQALARCVFSDNAARLKLNGIIHPYVLREMFSQYDRLALPVGVSLVIFDIPLLIECGAYRRMDRNVVVVAEDTVRIARICARSGTTEDDARARISSQISQEEQMRYADVVLDNSAGLAQLQEKVATLYLSLLGETQL